MTTHYAVSFALATVLSALVTWRAMRTRQRREAGWLAVAMGGVTWWSLMKLSEVLVGQFEGIQMLFNALHWIGVWMVTIGVLGVGLTLSGRGDRLTPRRVVALSVIPSLSVAAWFGDPRVVDLLVMYANVPAAVVAILELLADSWDWFEWVVLSYLYIVVLVGTIFLLETLLERPKWDPSRLLIGLMIAIPWSVNILSELGVIRYSGFDPTVFGFVATGVIGITVIDRVRLFDIPFARSEIVEQLSSPVLVYGRNCRLYDYNRRAEQLLGIESDDIERDVRDVLAATPVSVPDGVTNDPVELAENLHEMRVSIDDEETSTRHFVVHVAPLDSGPITELGHTIQLTDITEQHRQLDQITEQKERLDEFASIVSHDLRNPLHVAQGRLEMARAESGSEHLDDVAVAHERMERLIEELLAVSRHAGTVDRDPVVLSDVVETAWENVETVSARLDNTTARTVSADPDYLQQLFENLIRNAVQHNNSTVTVTVGELETGFYVADNGTGIPDDDADRIFDVDYSTSEDGTGIGLYIVKQIADDHGWEIHITESEAGGTRFEFTNVELE